MFGSSLGGTLTSIAVPDLMVFARITGVSRLGCRVRMPVEFSPGCAIKLQLGDSELFGCVNHTNRCGEGFEAAIEITGAIFGTSEHAKRLKEMLAEGLCRSRSNAARV
jgi:hypothetical protein